MKNCALYRSDLSVRLVWIGLSCLAVSACHTSKSQPADQAQDPRNGAVSITLAPAAAAQQVQLKRSEHAFGAEPVVHDAPIYPAALIPRNLPARTIRVKAIIDESGRVIEVRDMDVSSDADHAAFVTACRDVMLRWTYTPMTLVQEIDDGKGNISQVRKNAAFSLDYVFHFTLLDGRPAVTTGR